MFPLNDENPTLRTPVATMVLIGLNVLSWILVQGMGSETSLSSSICTYGFIPGELFGAFEPGSAVRLGNTVCQFDNAATVNLFTSMFMHGGWFHIIGNLWFLWVFGDNVEDAMGPIRFFIFYLLCGLAAAFAQGLTNPSSPIPMVGASGAIGGVMGAYALLYPKTRVNTFIFLGFFATTLAVPAYVMLGYWFVIQVLSGLPALSSGAGGVAFWAHIGGFLAGLGLVLIFKREDYLIAHKALTNRQKSRYRF